ncbi:MAG: cell division protein DedD [Arsenophonus sp. ET-YP4-MAG3]
MVSKFQNHLVVIIFIITISVIVFLILLDMKKKYNENKFIDMSLFPNVTDEYEIKSITPIKLKILPTPPENIGKIIISKVISNSNAKLINSFSIQKKINFKQKVKIEKPILLQEKNIKLNNKIQAPRGQAYVIQLGVLKNTVKIEEIIDKLRLSGYQAYTDPSFPINGQLTRIFTGLNTSIEKLQFNLQELKKITGLQGQIRNYKP